MRYFDHAIGKPLIVPWLYFMSFLLSFFFWFHKHLTNSSFHHSRWCSGVWSWQFILESFIVIISDSQTCQVSWWISYELSTDHYTGQYARLCRSTTMVPHRWGLSHLWWTLSFLSVGRIGQYWRICTVHATTGKKGCYRPNHNGTHFVVALICIHDSRYFKIQLTSFLGSFCLLHCFGVDMMNQ